MRLTLGKVRLAGGVGACSLVVFASATRLVSFAPTLILRGCQWGQVSRVCIRSVAQGCGPRGRCSQDFGPGARRYQHSPCEDGTGEVPPTQTGSTWGPVVSEWRWGDTSSSLDIRVCESRSPSRMRLRAPVCPEERNHRRPAPRKRSRSAVRGFDRRPEVVQDPLLLVLYACYGRYGAHRFERVSQDNGAVRAEKSGTHSRQHPSLHTASCPNSSQSIIRAQTRDGGQCYAPILPFGREGKE